MPAETKICQSCKTQFTIEPADFLFYEKMKVPAPTLCPDCRRQRRLAFRNEIFYYPNACRNCGKAVVSIYSKNKERVVYCLECWNSDQYNPLIYGREFDFSKTFTQQFGELLKVVPRVAMLNSRSENCEYTQFCADCKNCYMLIQSSNDEECYYSYGMQQSKDCIDTIFAHSSELCYEATSIENCYGVRYSKNCENCNDGAFLVSCTGCTSCIGCVNLRNKKYCIFNVQKTKEEYEAFLKGARLDTWSGVEKMKKRFQEFLIKQPRKFAEVSHAENSTGNYLRRAKNAIHVFNGYDIENVKYGESVLRNVKDCMDVASCLRDSELVYESFNTSVNAYNDRFCSTCRINNTNLTYCDHCIGSNESFGCVGLKQNEFCILNRQYPKEEYLALKDNIIAHMQKTGEWGMFFNPALSSFGYNETNAQEWYPFTKEQALSQGFLWEDTMCATVGKETMKMDALPDCIDQVSDSILNEVLACQCNTCELHEQKACGRNYKIIKQELLFYKKHKIPIPRQCFMCRHFSRLRDHGPYRLWSRQCMCDRQAHGHSARCPNNFETTYSPERREIVYCEACYNAEVI